MESRLTLAEARARLLEAGITGPHQSHTRANAISKIRAAVQGDPDGTFGLSGIDKYSPEQILGFMAELTGCSPDIDDESGCDTIDPDRTLAGIVAAGARLRQEAERGATLFAATGHPTGLLEHHIWVVDAYRRAGGKPVRLREEEQLFGPRERAEIRYNGGVGCLADWGRLKHTHSPQAMEALLDEGPWPDIVLADHGFAGAAIERGIPVIAVMDINDPALAVAWAEDKDVVVVPMDDNRPPRLYEPSWRLIEQVLAGENPA